MRSYLTIVDDHIDLLPYWLRWQYAIGATEIAATIYGDCDPRLAVEDVGLRYTLLGRYSPDKYLEHDLNGRQYESSIDGWSITCDLDEFPIVYLPSAIKYAEKSGDDFVAGRWVGRIGSCGRLVDIDQSLTLSEQFPKRLAESEYCERWFSGPREVIIATKAPPRSHHPPHKVGKYYAVQHFKWQANLLERIDKRIRRAAKLGNRERWLEQLIVLKDRIGKFKTEKAAELWI